MRIARNVNGLLRGIAARIGGVEPEIDFAAAPPSCYVSSQRILCCLGSILQHVGIVAKEPVLDASIDAFVPHVGKVLRTLFARFRKDLGDGGLRDAEELLGGMKSSAELCCAVSGQNRHCF